MKEFIKHFRYALPHIILCSLLFVAYYSWGASGIVDLNNSTLSNNSLIKTNGSDFKGTIQNVAIELIQAAQIAFNGVALLAMLYVGYLWISSMGDEEKQNDGKYRILLIIIGLFLINIPELIYNIVTGSTYLEDNFWRKVQTVSTRDPGGIFTEGDLYQCNYFFCAQNFWGNGSTVAIMKFLEVIMIAAAVVMFTWGGFTMLFRGNSEDRSDKGKMRIIYGIVALIIIGFIEGIYKAVFFGGPLKTSGLMSILMSVGNFFLFMAGPVAIVFIIVGAYFYITAGGDEERGDKGKRIITYTFLATILLLLSYTIIVEIVGINLI